MKKLMVLSLICATVAIACGKKMAPSTNATNNETKGAGSKTAATSTTQPAASSTTNNSSTSNTTASNSTPGFKQGVPAEQMPPTSARDQGKIVFVTYCGKCHAFKYPGDYTADHWNSILKTEIGRAKLNKEEGDQVTTFILSNAKK